MPPLVDPGDVTASSSSASMDNLMSTSKSSNDLMQLKRRAGLDEGRRNLPPKLSYVKQGSSAVCATSMEKFGSYIFESFSKKQETTASTAGSEEFASLQKPNDGDDDDASTTSTVVHFDDSDFLPSNWTGVAEYIPPLGMAVVAGGLLFMAPIVFVGGILTACTALGAVHAAQASYETCIEGNLSQIYEGEKDRSETDDKHQTDPTKTHQKETQNQVPSEVGFDVTEIGDSSSEVKSQVLNAPQLMEITSSRSWIPKDPSMLETCEQALEWVNHYYPPLAFNNVNNLEFKGLNALEYFDVFLADDAPYTFEELQKKRQDKNIRYGKWEDLTGVTQPSLVSAAATIESPKNEEEPKYHHHLKQRVLNFDAKTNNGFLGPPYATTTKVQRCLVPNKRLIVVESKTTMSNIPFSDRFYVLERWLITSQKRDDQYVSSMSVSCQVCFSKPCSFESFIITKSQETVTEIAKKWNEIAQKALQRTEEARRERLHQDKENSKTRRSAPSPAEEVSSKPPDANSGIEVECLGRSSSRIMGEGSPVVFSAEIVDVGGRPPSARRKGVVRRSLGRSFSGLIKRRQSNPV